MARRPPNDLTPSELGTPTDASSRPASDPAPLPRPPALPRPPRIPAGAARPGRRGETPSDNLMTGKIERVRGDATPAPLPPSPGARDAERWFEQVPTNPALPTIDPNDATSSHRKPQRSGQISLLTESHPAVAERAWLLPALIAAIALTIGMILGALLFSKSPSSKACAPCDAPSPKAQPKQ